MKKMIKQRNSEKEVILHYYKRKKTETEREREFQLEFGNSTSDRNWGTWTLCELGMLTVLGKKVKRMLRVEKQYRALARILSLGKSGNFVCVSLCVFFVAHRHDDDEDESLKFRLWSSGDD